MGEIITGAEALVRSLEEVGVEVMFGLPGGAILPVYDPILDSSIRHILVRHEQGAGHMAEGYAQASGKVGVAIVTSGPGATNIVTPIANAYMDSTPVVIITGQVSSSSLGTDAFQECDITGITMGISKHNCLIREASEIPRTIAEAFYVASTGRPGPVLVDLPKDVAQSEMEWHGVPAVSELDMPGYGGSGSIDDGTLSRARDLISDSKRPVIYAGGGIVKSGAEKELAGLAEMLDAPVVTTLMARGAMPDSDPRVLGMPGMHGVYTAVMAMQEADLLIAVGARFDDRVTGKLDGFARDAKIIHIDIDAAEIGKVRRADAGMAVDAKKGLVALLDGLAGVELKGRSEWWGILRAWQEKYPLVYEKSAGGLSPQGIIEEIARQAGREAIVASGVGQHQMWAAQHWDFESSRLWINSGGAGTMGFGVPAGIGAKVAMPEREVWVIDGDGCFQMTAQELITARVEQIPIKVAILNNSYLGMVRQWQEMFYEERYSEVYLSEEIPDYVMWAEAMGCAGRKVVREEDVEDAVAWARSITDRPVVLDFRTAAAEKVFPMVPSGESNDAILVHPSQRD